MIRLGDDYDRWIDGASAPEPAVTPAVDAHVALTYSSGTTGKPKGVMWTHQTMLGHTAAHLVDIDLSNDESLLHVAPMSHASGAYVLPVIYRGGAHLLLQRFDVDSFLDAIEDLRPTMIMVVPSMLYMLLERLETRSVDVPSVRTVIYGASPIAPDKLERAMQHFGPVFHQGYGMTEAMMCSLRKTDHVLGTERLGSAGRPSVFCELKLVDADGQPVPDGEVGEVWTRVLYPAVGYWQRPEATAEAWTADGFFKTADLARFDAEAYLYLVDRKADMIISAGYNVYPREVEDVLLAHPDVTEAAVVSKPHPKWGESVDAGVCRTASSATTAEEFGTWCRERLSDYKVPRSFDVGTEPLPKGATGKILRRVIRDAFWADSDRRVG